MSERIDHNKLLQCIATCLHAGACAECPYNKKGCMKRFMREVRKYIKDKEGLRYEENY